MTVEPQTRASILVRHRQTVTTEEIQRALGTYGTVVVAPVPSLRAVVRATFADDRGLEACL